MALTAEPTGEPRGRNTGREEIGLRADGLPDAPRPTARDRDRDWLRKAWPPLMVLLAGAVVLALPTLGAGSALRAVPVLAYIAVVPGLACVRLVRLPDRATELILGVVVSLALGTLVAQAMIYLHRWSPLLGLSVLVAIASLAALTELLRLIKPDRSTRRQLS